MKREDLPPRGSPRCMPSGPSITHPSIQRWSSSRKTLSSAHRRGWGLRNPNPLSFPFSPSPPPSIQIDDGAVARPVRHRTLLPQPRRLLPSAGLSSPLLRPPAALVRSHPTDRPTPASASPERGTAAQRPRRRSWLARRRARACFEARRSVELAGPRRARGLPRVCGGVATHLPRVSGHQDVADASLGGRCPPRAAGNGRRLCEGAPWQSGHGRARSEGRACCCRCHCPLPLYLISHSLSV